MEKGQKLFKETGICQRGHYIDANNTLDWEAKKIAWLKQGEEPA